MDQTIISTATVRRLPLYWRILKELQSSKREVVSCTKIAEKLNLTSIQVRKDLACTGLVGKPRVGYKVTELINAIEAFLGWNDTQDAFVVGVGSIGRALMGYKGFEDIGLNIVAGFDSNPEVVGTAVHGKTILHIDDLVELAIRMHIHIGIIAVPISAAQEVANIMTLGGIRAIWNFAPVKLEVHPDVILEDVHLSTSFAVLSSKLNQSLKDTASRKDL